MKWTPGRRWTLVLVGALALTIVVTAVLDRQRTPAPLRLRVDLTDQGIPLRTVAVYFVEPDSLALVSEAREVLVEAAAGALVRALVQELTEPGEGLAAPLPPGTRLLHAFQTDGEVVLDFNESIRSLGAGSILEEELRLTALCRTLAENVPRVERVRLLVLGRPLTRWGDHLELPTSLEVRRS